MLMSAEAGASVDLTGGRDGRPVRDLGAKTETRCLMRFRPRRIRTETERTEGAFI